MFLVYMTMLQQMRKSFTYIPLRVALKSEFLINKKHLKTHNERNRDKLLNIIKSQVLKNYVLEKVNLQHFPLCGEFSRQL